MSMREDFAGVLVPNTLSIDWQPVMLAPSVAAVDVASKDDRKPRRVGLATSGLSPELSLRQTQDNWCAALIELSDVFMRRSLTIGWHVIAVVCWLLSHLLAVRG